MNESTRLVLLELERLQRHPQEAILLVEQIPIGLGGQITRRLDGLLCGLLLGRSVHFNSDEDYPYLKSFQGMSCKTNFSPNWSSEPITDFSSSDTVDQLIIDARTPSPRTTAGTLCESIVLAVERRLGTKFKHPFELDGAILQWMKLDPPMQEYVDIEHERLGIDSSTLGVHFRRGDKKIETPYLSSDQINQAIANQCAMHGYRKVFIASDSPDALNLLSVPTGVAKIFDESEKRYNNANHKMLFSSPELASEETKIALKNVILLGECQGIVGQDNAHFATLAAARIIQRTGDPSRVTLLDGHSQLRDSRVLRMITAGNTMLRTLAKKFFPWMTVTARAERQRNRAK